MEQWELESPFRIAWSEATLIKLAYSYEQHTRHRRPPAATPPVR
jgi:hypothetical protein